MFRAAARLCILLSVCTFARAGDSAAEAFAALPLIEAPRISPDGTRFASLLSMHGRQLLAVVNLADGSNKLVSIADTNELVDWEWVNDEWLIMRLAASQNVMGNTWRVRRAYGVRASDAKVVSLDRSGDGQDAADILWIARDGTPRVLLAIQQSLFSNEEKFFPEVFEVNISNGKRVSRAKARPGVMDWYADSNGVVRIGIGYRDLSRTAQLFYRDAQGQAFRLIDRAKLRKGESLPPVPALFLDEPGKALAYSSHSGYSSLYELDLETHALGQEVFSVPGYDIGDLVTDSSGRSLIGVRHTDQRERTTWLEPTMSKAQRDLDKALGPARHATIMSMSRDQRRLIVHAASPSDPGAYFLMDLDERSLSQIARVQPSLEPFTTGSVRTLHYPARDGLMIEAVLTLPPDQDPAALPLIVMPHGGPQVRDEEAFDWWAQYLAHKGYAVVQPNYRGSSGYGSDFLAKGDGEWGLAMQDDLLDVVDHLAKQGIADPARVCIMGGSYGGYAALRGAQRDGKRLRCAISFAGISDLVAMVQEDRHYLNAGLQRDAQMRRTPDLEAVSPIHGAADIEIPVLLVHGRRDLTVHFSQSANMARELSAAGKIVRHVELPQGDHHLRRAEDRLTFLREVGAFLDAHNPAGSPAGPQH